MTNLDGPLLEVRNLSKTFDLNRVLSSVDLDIRAGEVHALIGENGSGKSTLIKCLSGFYEPDPGSSFKLRRSAGSAGEEIRHGDPSLRFVHQDLALVPSLSVAENLRLGADVPESPLGRMNWRQINREATRLLHDHGCHINGTDLVGDLSVADQTMLAIVRATSGSAHDAKVLVLDEPTAALGDADVDVLFKLVADLQARGVGILYVSHRLDEIYRIASRVTILRDGVSQGTHDLKSLAESELIRLIIGREVDDLYPPHHREAVAATEVLRVSGLRGSRRITDVSFELAAGEIVGVCGVRGSGRSELARLLSGVEQPQGGQVWVRGREVTLRKPQDGIRNGIALVPEDRRGQGVILEHSIQSNMAVTEYSAFARPKRALGPMSKAAEERNAKQLIGLFDVRPAVPNFPLALMSGGNQQKVAIAKWRNRGLNVLILDEPAQGVDVGAKAQIFRAITDAANRGIGVLVVSSDLDDIAHLCDRAIVLREGRITKELEKARLNRTELTHAVHAWEFIS